ncbi:MAG TPA: enolase [Acholeplasmataceae bacterium]|jgi:hypothetical protein|nr:enolase [Acholeplasmataceae bacterium]
MDILTVPVIVILCYLVGEIYKIIVKKNKAKYKYIPVVVSIAGGLFGLLFYFAYPEIVLNAENPVIAIVIGIVSGAASTGGNQIIKQLFNNNDSEEKISQ